MSKPAETTPADQDALSQALELGFSSALSDFGQFNLALFGPTGVGKSTLVNAVFGDDLAATGVGQPVTQDSFLYRTQGSALGILDTQGLEVGQHDQEILSDLRKLIDRVRHQPLSDHIHVAWYCVRATARRFQNSEESFVRQLAELDLPVLLVITQTPTSNGQIDPSVQELAADIEKRRMPVFGGKVFLVNALSDEWMGTQAHGLPELLEATTAAAPLGVRAALAAAQRVDRKQKRREAEELIAGAGQRAHGRVIPKAAAGIWGEMIAGISTIYGLPESIALDTAMRSQELLRIRKILNRGRAGLLVFGGIQTAVALGVASATAANEKRKQRKGGGPGPVEEFEGERVTRSRVGSGLSAQKTTLAVGEAWLDTVEHFWLQSYPDQPVWQTQPLADRFTEEMASRMARPLQVRKKG